MPKKRKPKPIPPGEYNAKVIEKDNKFYAEITSDKFKGMQFYLGPTDWYKPGKKVKDHLP